MMGAGALAGLSMAPAQDSAQQVSPSANVPAAEQPVMLADASASPPMTQGINLAALSSEGATAGKSDAALDQAEHQRQLDHQRQLALMETFASFPAESMPPDQGAAQPEPVSAQASEPDPGEVPLPRSRPAEAAGMQLASASATAVELPRRATPPKKSARDTGVLNDAQIASIKERLHLTPEQQRYWPAVEAALRRIAWDSKQMKKHHRLVKPSDGPAIDMNGPGVAQLKSAAFPLVMSFSEDQKSEVRRFANLIGLSKLAQQF
jgi:hypothetical protein